METIVITGANRGLGLEFARQYAERGERVVATCRNRSAATELAALAAGNERLEVRELEVTDPASRQAFAESLAGWPIDMLIANAGVYGPRRADLASITAEDWQETLAVNTIAPVLLTASLLPSLRAGNGKRLIYLSSKMGSISDNSSGGSYIYRSSKAALNAAVKSLAHDLAGDGFTAVLLHPGWVATDMGGASAPTGVSESVSGMVSVIDGLSRQDSGRFIDFRGADIGW